MLVSRRTLHVGLTGAILEGQRTIVQPWIAALPIALGGQARPQFADIQVAHTRRMDNMRGTKTGKRGAETSDIVHAA